MNRIKLCIVAHNAYGMMSGDKGRHIGGVEHQTSNMARWLSTRGHEVSLVTWQEGTRQIEMIDGVRIVKTCSRESGIPGIRFFWPRWTSLVKALRTADADIYYQNGAEYVTGQVAMWASRNGRKFVFSIASDVEVARDLKHFRTVRERVLYRIGLSKADRIIAQTEAQTERLKREFELDAIPLPMPCFGFDEEAHAKPPSIGKGRMVVLFVGRIAEVKRIELLLDVAKACPDQEFWIVGGGNRGEAYERKMMSRANQLENVSMQGPVGRSELHKYFSSANIFLCTSEHEGFPNTFLEAWSAGLPIVSTVDPDRLIERMQLGRIASDVEGLAAAVQAFACGDGELWLRCSENAKKYFRDNHESEAALSRFEKMFSDLADSK